MAGKYLTQWTALKTKFEEDAGKKIASRTCSVLRGLY